MPSPEPYTRDELETVGDAFPDRGTFCPRCDNFIPNFADLTDEEEAELRKLRPLLAMKALHEQLNCPLTWAKIWALHPNGPHSVDPSKPCPYCELPLHPNAKQCLLCKMDWHDENNPIRRGASIAEQILAAETGATIPVAGRNALGSAIHYAELKRPNADLNFVLQPPAESPKTKAASG